MKIKEIPLENRPRERLKRLGPEALSDAEVLAIILQKGTREENVIDMSNRLIGAYGLDKLSECSLVELQKIKGIGPAKAMQIMAVFEINKRYKLSQRDGKPIKSAKDVFEYAAPKIGGKDKEHFMVLLLDSKNRVIKDEIVSIGTLNAALVHPREIFKSAIKESANAIILVHNHPSGDCEISEEDSTITKKLKQAGTEIGIKIIDHIIISGTEWSRIL